jgi:sugar/nucleoside kinase (ribokinase family)
VSTYDLFVAGRPSVDVMFAGLEEWPELGNDIDADALGVCAGTSFNTPAAANRIGLRVAYFAEIGNDIEAAGLGVCAGTSFNTPAAANRIGLRVAYVAEIGNDVWSRMIREEFEAEGLSTEFLVEEEQALPAVSVAFNMEGDRGFVSHWGGGPAVDDRIDERALSLLATVDARHLHAQVDDTPVLESAARANGMTVSVDAFDGASSTSCSRTRPKRARWRARAIATLPWRRSPRTATAS